MVRAQASGSSRAPLHSAELEDDVMTKGFVALMIAKLVSIGLGVFHELYLVFLTKRGHNQEDLVLFLLDSVFFLAFYFSNLVRFIHRFSVTLRAADLVDDEGNYVKQPVLDAVARQIQRRRLLVYAFCLVGIIISVFAAVRQLKGFSGLDLKLSELVSLVVSLASTFLYAWLLNFYQKTKTSKFTLEDEVPMFAAIEKFVTKYCIISEDIQLIPEMSFTFRALY